MAEAGTDEAQAFDKILRKLEGTLAKADEVDDEVAARASVKFQGIVLDLFAHMDAARSLMMAVLKSENTKRTVLQHVFGGDCVRISRARAVIESAVAMGLCGRHQMAEDCLRTCESVEQVLGDLGLGFSLRQAQIQQRELLKRRRSGGKNSRASEASSPASPVDTKQRRPSPKPSGTPEVMSATPSPMPKQEPPMSPLCNELENRISADDELQMCTVADEPRTNAGYPDEKGEAAQSSKDARASSSSRGSRRDEKTEPEAEPILVHPDTRRSLINEDGKEEPIRFAPHLAVLAGRVFLHYASGDCTSGTGLSSTRFRCFLRDCSILSCSSEAGESLQRGPSSSDASIDRKCPAGLVVARTRSSSVTRGPRQMSRRLSGSFTAGFGTTAEAAAAENGKLPLRLCLQPVLTRAQADLLYIQAMRQQEVHMTQDSFIRALAIVGQQCLSAGVDDVEDADTDAGILNWFCQWALVPLAEALGISEHDVLCAAQILREREVSALLRSCQRGLDIVFARYAKASPAPRDPYRKGFWTVQSMQRFAAESDLSAELSHQCLQRIFTGCVQHERSVERRTISGSMSASCFRLALIVIAQRVHSAPGCTPLMRVAMFMLRLSICRGASDLGVAARAVLGKPVSRRIT